MGLRNPKNVAVSEELLAAMTKAARTSGKTVDEMFEEGGRRLLEHSALEALARRGRSYALRVGKKSSEAVAAVRAVRRGR